MFSYDLVELWEYGRRSRGEKEGMYRKAHNGLMKGKKGMEWGVERELTVKI